MSLSRLQPGDRCTFEKTGKDGKVRKLRCTVTDSMNMKAKGEEQLVPVIRPCNRANIKCNADHLDPAKARPLKVRWIKRSLLRKLPEP